MSDPLTQSVADLMVTTVPTVPETMPAFEVARRMDRERIRHMLVETDGHFGGLVDRAGLLRHLVAHYRTPHADVSIASFVIQSPVTIGAAASAADAIRLMRRHRIGSLPVLDGKGRLVGLLSERRLMAAAEALLAQAPQ